MLNDKNFLKMIKRNLLNSDSVKHTNSACPSCANLLTYSQVWTHAVPLAASKVGPFDESGWSVGECDGCKTVFSVSVVNPDFSEFVLGATKTRFVLEDEAGDADLQFVARLVKLTDSLDKSFDMNKRSFDYDYNGRSLYECGKCEEGLDSKIYEALLGVFDKLKQGSCSYLEWSLKNGGSDPEYIVSRLQIRCGCGNALVAFIGKPYSQDHNFVAHDFSILNVVGAKKLPEVIKPGIYSKDQVMECLYKLLPRWAVLFDTIYLMVPFVGHLYMSSEKIVGIWEELISRVDPRKVRLVTKKDQINKFKKAYHEHYQVDYQQLEKLKLSSELVNGTVVNSKFHAKVYAATSPFGCEVYSGSANLLTGPSKEVMHFNEVSYSDFEDCFLSPLGVAAVAPGQTEIKYSFLLDSENNFSAFGRRSTIYAKDYFSLIIHDVLPLSA